MGEKKTDITACKVVKSTDFNFQTVLPLLKGFIEDSTLQKDFSYKVINHSHILTDKKNKWNREFASHYTLVAMASFTDKYAVVYCAHSGILNGFLSLPMRWHDVYVLDRQNGSTIKLIEIKKGLASASTYNDSIYLRFYDPDEIRVCPF